MNELDDLLRSLREERPPTADIARWKAVLTQTRRRKAYRWVELAAAMIVGILIGGTAFNRQSNEENAADHSTVERVITKIE